MITGPFSPTGPTYLVGTTPVQCSSTSGGSNTSYRIRNLLSTVQYFTWSANSSSISVTVPVAGTPSSAIGMLGNSVECFGNLLPANAYFVANAAAAFEVTPGEGL